MSHVSRIRDGEYCSFVLSLWSSTEEKSTFNVFRYQHQISTWQTLSLCCTSDYRDKRGCHAEALISSCSTYKLATPGSDCFSLCGCSISNICILHPHLKHLTSRRVCHALQNRSCVCSLHRRNTLHYRTDSCVFRNTLASYISTFAISVSVSRSYPLRDGF